MQSSYSYINVATRKDSDSLGLIADRPVEDGAPSHYFTLRSAYNFTDNLAFDFWAYDVDELTSSSLSAPRDDLIDACTSVNFNISWEPVKQIVLSLAGQNIFDRRHQGIVGEYFSTEIERSFYGQLRMEF